VSKKRLLISLSIAAAVGLAIAWVILSRPELPPEFAGGNGRLEAKTVDVATKYPGRLKEVLADEGDTVDAGQVVATLDTEPLEAQLRQAQADVRAASDNLRSALAQVEVKRAELEYAASEYSRSQQLVSTGAVSLQERDVDRAKADIARADLDGAKAQAIRAQSAIDAATAEAQRLTAEISDFTLRAPLRARVQSRLAEPGEVLGPGGKVLALNDLSDVYMYVFLPADVAGKVALGSEARIVLDALPQYPIRAIVSYVSPTAQFTPKTVETAEERHNLSFRVKLQLNKDRLRDYENLVKVGIPGMGYVRLDPRAEWPEKLRFKPVGEAPWQPTGAAPSGDSGAGGSN
jgi:HlyD family secretion protein